MTEPFSRRDWIKTLGAASAGALVPLALDIDATVARATAPLVSPDTVTPPVPPAPIRVRDVYAPGDIVDLYSTNDVFIPPRGRSWMKFSFDFPEPAVVFGEHRFSILIFTEENTYTLDRALMKATGDDNALELTCTGLVWAGGQEKAPGKVPESKPNPEAPPAAPAQACSTRPSPRRQKPTFSASKPSSAAA